MKKDDFQRFDDVHVPVQVKANLYDKIDKKEYIRRKQHMRTTIRTGIAVACACLAVFFVPMAFQKDTATDFSGYLKISASEVKEPLSAITKQKLELEKKLGTSEISVEEYLTAYEALNKEKEEVLKHQEALNKKYAIDTNSKEVKNNKDISAILEEIRQLELQDDALDKQEDALEKAYRNKEITKQQFIEKERQLDAQEDALDKKEDALEKQSGVDDDRYDDDDDDHDDDDQDDFDDDDDEDDD